MRLVAHGLYDYTVDEGEVQGVNRNYSLHLEEAEMDFAIPTYINEIEIYSVFTFVIVDIIFLNSSQISDI